MPCGETVKQKGEKIETKSESDLCVRHDHNSASYLFAIQSFCWYLSLFLLLLHQQSVHKTDHEGGRGRYLHFQLPGNIHEAGQLARN